MGLLVTYDINKTGNGTFKLTFTTVANTEVSYSYDSRKNINSVTLTAGTNTETNFSKIYNTVNDRLEIRFQPNGKPTITINDDE